MFKLKTKDYFYVTGRGSIFSAVLEEGIIESGAYACLDGDGANVFLHVAGLELFRRFLPKIDQVGEEFSLVAKVLDFELSQQWKTNRPNVDKWIIRSLNSDEVEKAKNFEAVYNQLWEGEQRRIKQIAEEIERERKVLFQNVSKTWIHLQNQLPVQAFLSHFEYLSENEESMAILQKISVMATNISIDEKRYELVIRFKDSLYLTASLPAKVQNKSLSEFPDSFLKLLQQHEQVALFDGTDPYYILGDIGSMCTSPWPGHNAKDVIVDYSDWYAYHPIEKDPDGEPALYFISHEDGSAVRAKGKVGDIFLHVLYKAVK